MPAGPAKRVELPLAMAYWATVKPGSRKGYGHSLRVISRICGFGDDWTRVPWGAVTPEVVAYVLEHAGEQGYKGSTQKRIAVIFKTIVRIAYRRGEYTEREVDGIVEAAKKHTPQEWNPAAGRRLTPAECKQQLRAATDPGDRRLLLLGMVYGLRKKELCRLKCSDVDPVKGTLRVWGKGDKERWVPLAPGMVRELMAQVEGRALSGPMFPSARGLHLDPSIMYRRLKGLRLAAGLEKWSPHDLRRTAVTQLLEAGHDPILVARAMGHSTPATTMMYDRRGDDATRGAFEKVGGELEDSDE